MKMKLIALWIATIKFASLVILKLTFVPFVAEVFSVDKILNPVMKEYHRTHRVSFAFFDDASQLAYIPLDSNNDNT